MQTCLMLREICSAIPSNILQNNINYFMLIYLSGNKLQFLIEHIVKQLSNYLELHDHIRIHNFISQLRKRYEDII